MPSDNYSYSFCMYLRLLLFEASSILLILSTLYQIIIFNKQFTFSLMNLSSFFNKTRDLPRVSSVYSQF